MAWQRTVACGHLWLWRLTHRPQGIVIHHSAFDKPLPDAVRAIERSHRQRGFGIIWKGRIYHIGYHWLVGPGGRLYQARPEWAPGAHCRGHNDCIGICLIGNLSRHPPSRAQMDALVRLVREIMRRWSIPPERVYLHRELGATACPGERFPATDFKRRISAPPRP